MCACVTGEEGRSQQQQHGFYECKVAVMVHVLVCGWGKDLGAGGRIIIGDNTSVAYNCTC